MNEVMASKRCSRQASCDLFPKLALSGALGVWHEFYCHARFERCARFKLAAEGRRVPFLLLPDGREVAPTPAAR